MIDFQTEKVLSLADATQVVPEIEGRRPCVSTLWRWAKHGVRGTRLEYLRIGNRLCTSVEALSRFSQRLAEADHKTQPELTTTKNPSNSKRLRSEKQADEILEAAG